MQFVVIEKETEHKTEQREGEGKRREERGCWAEATVHQSALNYFHNWPKDKRQLGNLKPV